MVKKRRKVSKPIGITKITKTNAKKLKTKMGIAMVFGTRTKPRLGTKRFRTIKMAREAFAKRR